MISHFTRGVSLIETVVFLAVISLALVALLNVYTFAVSNSVDPSLRARALAVAQAKLDEILARKFDENTPTGGIPACDSPGGQACLGIAPDADFDDVGDFDGQVDTGDPVHTLVVSVVDAGDEVGVPTTQARRITVTATVSGADSLVVSVYKTNF